MSLWKYCIPVLSVLGGLLPVTASAQIAFDTAVDYAVTDPEQAAAGDFDQDGDVDLAVTSDAPDKVSIFLNAGDGTFTAGTNVVLASSSSPHALVAGDFDDDGLIDLAVTRRDLNDVQILINQGSAIFALGATYPVGDESRHLATGTLDGNDSLDLVAVNRDGDTVSVLLNNGDGTFGATTNVAAGLEPREVAIADLNGDGDNDLAVAAHDSAAIVLLSNNGSGVFSAGPTLSTGSFNPEGVATGDLDYDGDIDVVGTGNNNNQNMIMVFLQTTPGAFSGPNNYSTGGTNPGGIVLGDFDLDADLDAAVANQDSDDVGVLANNGDGTFVAGVTFDTANGPEDVIAADLDENGALDLVSVNSDGSSISVLLNQTDSAFTDLGFALAGTNGLPRLEGVGTLQDGTNVRLTISNGLPGAPGFLVIGTTALNLPLSGGTLVPAPELILGFTLNSNGVAVFEGPWPSGIPAGVSVFFQAFFLDAGAVDKLAGTNALEGVTQ